jgi:hypothetical protein
MINPLVKYKGLPLPGGEAWKVDECHYDYKAEQPLTFIKEHLPDSSSPAGLELLRIFLSDEIGGMRVANTRLRHYAYEKIMRAGVVIHRSPALEMRCMPGMNHTNVMIVSWLNCTTANRGVQIQRSAVHSPVEVLGSFGGPDSPLGMTKVLTHLYRIRDEDRPFREEEFEKKLAQFSDRTLMRKPAYPRLMLGFVRDNHVSYKDGTRV